LTIHLNRILLLESFGNGIACFFLLYRT
jgi:hypothetical protein